MPVDQIVDMVAVRDGFVTTARAVRVARVVTGASVSAGTGVGIHRGDFDRVLMYHPVGPLMMKVTIVQIVDMITVLNGCMPAGFSVSMRMFAVTVRHDRTFRKV